MTDKKLSIILLVCDKDRHYLPNLLKQIELKVKIPHETIVIDNCTNPIEPDGNIKYFAFGYNAYLLMGRKKGIEIASGNYVWFIDSDDDIFPIDVEDSRYLEEDNDIIVFNMKNRKNLCAEIEKDIILKGNFLYESIYHAIGPTTVNKWIKTGILRKVEKCVPKNIDACALEDATLIIGALSYSKKIRLCTKYIYQWNANRGCTGNDVVENLDSFKLHTKGYLRTRNIILKFLKSAPDLAEAICNTNWYLSRTLALKDMNLLEECFNTYLKDCIDDYTRLQRDFRDVCLYESRKYPQSNWLRLVELLQKRYPGDSSFDPGTVVRNYRASHIVPKIKSGKAYADILADSSLKGVTFVET